MALLTEGSRQAECSADDKVGWPVSPLMRRRGWPVAPLTEVLGQAALHCRGGVGLGSLFLGVSIWAVSISPWLRGAGTEPEPVAPSKWHAF